MILVVASSAKVLTIREAATRLGCSPAWISMLLTRTTLDGPPGGRGEPRVWEESLRRYERGEGRRKPGRPRKASSPASSDKTVNLHIKDIEKRLARLEADSASGRHAALELKVAADNALDELSEERRMNQELKVEVAALRAILEIRDRDHATERKAREAYSDALGQLLVPGALPDADSK